MPTAFTQPLPPDTAFTPGGRLSVTGTVDISDATGGTLFYVPYTHTMIQLWDGTTWKSVEFTPQSLAVSGSTANLGYDVFGYLSGGTLALERLLWTASGRTIPLATPDGRLCKATDKTRLYLGTYYTEDGSTIHDTTTRRYLYNEHNAVRRQLFCRETQANWSWSGDWRSANGRTEATNLGLTAVALMLGRPRLLTATVKGAATCSSGVSTTAQGIGIGSATVNSALLYGQGAFASVAISFEGFYSGYPAEGWFKIYWLERASVSTTFYGNPVVEWQMGMFCEVDL